MDYLIGALLLIGLVWFLASREEKKKTSGGSHSPKEPVGRK